MDGGVPDAPTRESQRVVILCDFFPPSERAGGPSRSILAIVEMEQAHSSMLVVTRDRDLGARKPYSVESRYSVDSKLGGVVISRLRPLTQLADIWRTLRTALGRSEILYLNSLVSPMYSIVPLALMRFRLVPRTFVLLAPRGELGGAALKIKRLKKRLALPIIRWTLSKLDIAWHASSRLEAEEIDRFLRGLQQPKLIRANPAPAPVENCSIGQPDQRPTVVFVGRMVPIKNFMLIVRAVQKLAFPIRVIVAGAIEDSSYWNDCLVEMRRMRTTATFDIRGHVSDESLVEILSLAHALVLPTRGENFGRAIAEALSVGCPVIIPRTTLWTPLVEAGAGWLISTDEPDSLAMAMGQMASQSNDERLAMRLRVVDLYSHWWHQTQYRARPLFQSARDTLVATSKFDTRFVGQADRDWHVF